ncbi:MAG: ABC transporter substrate-binding protein [Gemmatimonadota bacterium]|nr:ABC transporter substrate-binding protein [Gemmatimonadota bacterium]
MFNNIRCALVLALIAGVSWRCGSESVTTSQIPEAGGAVGRAAGKLAVDGNTTWASVVARVRQGEAALSGVTVEFARSISGRASDYAWSGKTDARGRTHVRIAGNRVSGYYSARAMQGGTALGTWSSIPVHAGFESTVELPVGETSRVTASLRLTPGGLPEKILIGLVLPWEEPQRPFSQPIMNGFELGRAEINGSSRLDGARIEFILGNSRATAEGAVEAFERLIHQDGVPVILGPALSAGAVAAFSVAQQNQVVAFSSTSVAPGLSAIGDYIFRAGLSLGVLVPGGVEETKNRLDYRKVATIVDESDLFARASDEALRRALTDADVEILTRETFETGDSTFVEPLTRIVALNPDAIFVSGISPADRARILVEGRRIGIPANVPFIVPELTVDEVHAAGEAAEGAITFTGWVRSATTPGNRLFVENYTSTFGSDPNHWAAQSYAALNILAAAIAEAGSTDPGAIRDELAGIRNLDTILGRFSFNEAGDAVYDPIVLIVRDGEFEIFE